MTSINPVADYSVEGDVAIVTISSPPVNALSRDVREGLKLGVEKAEADPAVKATVVICAGRTFIAGADITEFGKPPAAPYLPDVLDRIENAKKPVIAALHGTALGGGFEVALTAHYRIAVPSAKCGLPEIKLGLIPGAGGTQRLPRLVGVETGARRHSVRNAVRRPRGEGLGRGRRARRGGQAQGRRDRLRQAV